MKTFVFSAVLISLFRLASADKMEELRELQLKSRDGLIQLNSTGYFYYTMEFPRPYDVVIFFTAPSCKLCKTLNKEFQQVAKFYVNSGSLYHTRDESGNKRPVFFATMNYDESNKQVFGQLGLISVPNLFVSQPKIVVVPQDELMTYLREYRWMISHTDGHVTAHKLLEYINRRTGRQVEYQPELSEVFMMIGILSGVITLIILLFRGMRTIFNNPTVWFVGSIIIYTVCMAGLVHNIIHNTPFTSVDNKGNIEWRTGGGRNQLGAEGFVMSLCITFAGLSIVLYHKVMNTSLLKDQPQLVRIVQLVLFVCTTLIVRFIEEIYRQKSWYDPKFWPPAGYVRGPLMNDQGNTI